MPEKAHGPEQPRFDESLCLRGVARQARGHRLDSLPTAHPDLDRRLGEACILPEADAALLQCQHPGCDRQCYLQVNHRTNEAILEGTLEIAHGGGAGPCDAFEADNSRLGLLGTLGGWLLHQLEIVFQEERRP